MGKGHDRVTLRQRLMETAKKHYDYETTEILMEAAQYIQFLEAYRDELEYELRHRYTP